MRVSVNYGKTNKSIAFRLRIHKPVHYKYYNNVRASCSRHTANYHYFVLSELIEIIYVHGLLNGLKRGAPLLYFIHPLPVTGFGWSFFGFAG